MQPATSFSNSVTKYVINRDGLLYLLIYFVVKSILQKQRRRKDGVINWFSLHFANRRRY